MSNSKQQEFLKAYKACHEPFMKYCSALAYGKFDVQDLVQDVLLTTFQNFEKIRNKDQLLHYLIRAARNKNISYWRKEKYKADLEAKHTDRLKSQEVSPEDLLDIQLLYKMLDQLSEKQKEALVLFEISGFSMKEIAEIQDSSVGAIKTKISRGRTKLKELMKNDDEQISGAFGSLKLILI